MVNKEEFYGVGFNTLVRMGFYQHTESEPKGVNVIYDL